ncbi:tRNA pseudouridine(55) synthase TruB [Candidatus Peregrinibacteria bacterium CG11_big_fil_rev_8_21_14_0_20_41_10]|nr:MAG: tRNA pseudouridine(55) synthase TruB [Candidatus Peregrinibacteria bacterium CG11_big_fil_rev_8_21_14_0_20_41_10]PIZ74557.1 MAG: tRNA pseudouridine(55) synthase TruB [Candidatus Peregrinibacteria bacterium CG_4_10_14_0_2_um_filter_41_8]PJC37843.1 MAG: tRNA pseudouridine(55) synthase TruB [Candidatus Peregrinibacteria bacterium CG_4_9_14_0_2_um_filter_41_14]
MSLTYNMENFFLNINKPSDWTSFDVVKKVRGAVGIKKVGHLGTLDPFATGVLPLAFNKATRLIQYLQEDEKEYIATVELGKVSTTGDTEGEIADVKPAAKLALSAVEVALRAFIGEIMQIPPKYSAIKVEGKRAYDLIRAGKEFELKARPVFVKSIDIITYDWPILKLRVVCGKGFYVRSLASDLGEALEVGGYLTALERTRVGCFNMDNWVQMEAIEKGSWAVGKIGLLEAWGVRPKYYLETGEWEQLKLGQFISPLIAVDGVTAGVLNDEMVCLLEPVLRLPGKMKMAVIM